MRNTLVHCWGRKPLLRTLQKPPRPSSTGEPSGLRQTSTSAALMMGTLHLCRSAVLSISSSTDRREDMSWECAAPPHTKAGPVKTYPLKQCIHTASRAYML